MQTRSGTKRRRHSSPAPRRSTRARRPSARAGQPAARQGATRTVKTVKTVKRTRQSSARGCREPLEAYNKAYDMMGLLRQRKAAETAANKLHTRIRSLDAKVWRYYNEIIKGTCSVAAFRNMFKAMDERIPLEIELERQKKAMITIDDTIRESKYKIGMILKNVNSYVGSSGSNSNVEENLR